MELNSCNDFFQDRLDDYISNKKIVYLDILGFDEIPYDWILVEESEDEKIKKEEKILNEKDKNIIQEINGGNKEFNEGDWLIGWRGEYFVYRKLIKKFGIDNVYWHNKDAKSSSDDKKGIDIEVKNNLGITVHNIEVKTTKKSTAKGMNNKENVTFYMSINQYKAAQTYGKDTHLIFVTGIDENPELLYMNFDNNWLGKS